MGSGMVVVGACHKKSGISSRVGSSCRVYIGGKVGIEASSNKDVFRLYIVPLLLYGALSVVYSRGVGKWALPH